MEDEKKQKSMMDHVTDTLAYSERTFRSVSAVFVGITTFLTGTLLPKSLRNTNIYRVTLGMLQQFIMEKIAEVEKEAVGEDEFDIGEDFAQRKLAGTVIEAAGLATVGFSPLWVFAIIGDGVAGSKIYMNRLVEQLKEDGLIEEDAEMNEIVDVFDAVQNASSKSATALDMPPLSREDFSTLVTDMTTGYKKVFTQTGAVMPQLDTMWESMEQLASRENISLERVAGIMSYDAMTHGAGVVYAVGKTGVVLFDEKILDSYRQTLTAMYQEGADHYVANHMRPFLDAARAQFDPQKETWIQRRFGKR